MIKRGSSFRVLGSPFLTMSSSSIDDQNLEIDAANTLRAGFVQKIREYVENQGFTDVILRTSSGSKKGDNYCGNLTRIRVEASADNGQKEIFHWISKSAPFQDGFRKIIRADALYEKEIVTYQKLLPSLRRFEEMKGIARPFDSYPEHILTHLEPDQENLVMLDMKSVGFAMKNKVEALDYDHVALVMKTYAELHAISYAMRDQDPEGFDRIKRGAKDIYFCRQDYDEEIIGKFEGNYREQLLGCLDPQTDSEIIEVLEVLLRGPNSIVMEAIAEINEFSVVIHGDAWLNNMLFKYDDPNHPGVPTKACLLDFQLVRIGSPAFDLVYFIFSCTDKQFRDKYYDELIELYFSALHGRIREFGSDPNALIPFDVFAKELKRYAVVGFYLSTIVLKFMLNPDDETPEWSKAEDVQGLVEAMNFKSSHDAVYTDRVRGVIIDIVEKGYLDFLKG